MPDDRALTFQSGPNYQVVDVIGELESLLYVNIQLILLSFPFQFYISIRTLVCA
jgi:hypothetical protein